ncbi:lycopene beta-cyclase CrtY [Erythrobacter aquimaris]|uniref:Lycopene beta-cyclase CrtY n=1 Tax=Qipengyuania aquimaris TaxID=255984 RepID=A0A6I4TJX0_9SPHN|nr:lycopene beta-cyclase CrtY [Qipengyuania aquimaris]MXO94868.1 lycopene beta-cyclase CrtY [Qipengyuania aquimaris]
MGREYDIAVVGGGLAGGLTALAIHRAHPAIRIALVEAGESFGGNHRWSWFEHDLGPEATDLLSGFTATSWTGGNEVRFPAHRRKLAANYCSLDSRDFDAHLRRQLPQDAILTGMRAASLRADRVEIGGGPDIKARAVIDCRDAVPSEHLAGGWQVFLGQHLRTRAPHGIERPVIMDATVNQPGAYRFIYLLPLGANEIFVEDTYYADSPVLDREMLARRIEDYAKAKGWSAEVLHEETGVLPVITGGNFTAYRASLQQPGVALSGARGGFVHPLTSYTMPVAAANALAIAGAAHLPGTELSDFVEKRAQEHWRRTRFYRLLGKMLFDAAIPEERYRVFERFYRLPEPLIERFYAARSTRFDKLRILSGKPPVPISRAVTALLGKGAPLVHESHR